MISAGTKIAKAVGSRIVKTKEGAIAFEVAFEFLEDNQKHQLTWQGWLKNKNGGTDAMDRTLKTLIEVLEFNGDEQVVDVPETDSKRGMLANQDAINRQKEVQLVVEAEEYNGNTRMRIKWVNNIGGGGFSGMAPEVVVNDLNAIGFKAAFLAKKGAAGTKSEEAKAFASAPTEQVEADVPF